MWTTAERFSVRVNGNTNYLKTMQIHITANIFDYGPTAS